MQQFLHSKLCRSFASQIRLAIVVLSLFSLHSPLLASANISEVDTSSSYPTSSFERTLTTQENDNCFILEEVPGKFKILKAVVNGKDIYIRPGLLEVFLDPSNRDESSYLLFQGANTNISPEGVNQISKSKKEISHAAMARVLGETMLDQTVFEKVVYRDLYEGVDLELSIGKLGIRFKLITKDVKKAVSDFEIKVMAKANMNSRRNSISISHPTKNNGLEIISEDDSLKINNSNNIQFSPNSDSIENLTFDIILK